MYHLLFDGPPLAQRGQRLQWPRPAWVSTSWLHWGEVRSLDQVYHTVQSGGDHSYPTVREECTWKTQHWSLLLNLKIELILPNRTSAPRSNITQFYHLHWCELRIIIWITTDGQRHEHSGTQFAYKVTLLLQLCSSNRHQCLASVCCYVFICLNSSDTSVGVSCRSQMFALCNIPLKYGALSCALSCITVLFSTWRTTEQKRFFQLPII